MDIILLILYIVCLVLYILNAYIQKEKSVKVLWSIGALCWAVCIVLGIMKFYIQ